MIEIIDQINNTTKKVPGPLEIVIDPAGNPLFLEEYQIEGHDITGIIHKKDGSTIFTYEKTEKPHVYVVLIRTIPNAMNPNSWIRGVYTTYEIAKEKAFEGWKGTITMRHEKNMIDTFGYSTFYFDLKALDDVLPYIIEIRKCEVDL